MSAPPAIITLEHIRDRCTETPDGCWIWTGAVSKPRHQRTGQPMPGHPIIKNGRRGCLLVRREVLRLDGRELAPRQPSQASCDHRLCVNPKHLSPSTTSAVAAQAAARGAFSGFERAKAIAEGRRLMPDVKMDMERARAIRSSSESGTVLAKRHGVHRSLINAIRRGERWAEYDDEAAFHIHQLGQLAKRVTREANRITREHEEHEQHRTPHHRPAQPPHGNPGQPA